MKTRLAAAVALTLIVATGGCGSSSQTKAAGDNGLTKITLNTLAIAQMAPIVLGEKQGFFKKQGLDLSIKYVEAPAIIPSVVSGQADFGYLNAPAVLVARSNGVPVKSVTSYAVAGDDPSYPIQLLVAKDSPLKSPKDLVGKTIAVDTLFQLPDLGLRNALLNSGVDPNSVKRVEIPFPEMGQALAAKRVDAILATEPFITINAKSGAVPLLSASQGTPPKAPQSVLLSSEKFISGNPKLVKEFQEAVTESTDYAVAHDAEMRATVPTFTQLPAALAMVVKFAKPSTVDDPAGWQFWADLLVKVGAVKNAPDAKAAFLAD